MRQQWRFAWRFSFRATGWLMAFIGGWVVVGGLLINLSNERLLVDSLSSFDVVIPLFVGLNAALLFAPDDEPALEVLLAAPRPTPYLIYERVATLVIVQGGIGLILSVVASLTSTESNLAVIVLRWAAPAICMMGLCTLATLYSRRSAFGVLVAVVICAAMAVGNAVILPVFPDLWFLIFYVQPQDVSGQQYLINRLFLTAVGMGAMLMVIYRLRDVEKLLGFQEAKNG
ncbi:MAG: hypothetical protein JNJ78_00320 [Anaerolineae bacterium]|nr:hypothetical protein [Anaerolineae bacterium]